MDGIFDSERRKYLRIRDEIIISCKFMNSSISDPASDKIYEGKVINMSGGGIMMRGPIPNPQWIPELLSQRMAVGIRFLLPGEEEPIKALTRVAWIGAVDESSHNYRIGLRFEELAVKDVDKIIKFIIKGKFT